MTSTRRWVLFAGLLGFAAGLAGCGDATKTGTSVPVDMAKEEAQRKEMSQFYGPAKKPGKSR